MAFTGTLDKCKACDKTVYFVDMMSLEGMPYHKSCFRCSHCNSTLQMSNYSSMDGVLYCKPHFEQLFKESGNFSKNFQTGKSAERQEQVVENVLHFLSPFSYESKCGTQDKCYVCHKTVYPLEKMTLEGENYHKTCFRCAHGGCPLTQSSYAALDGVLYCRHHFAQLFMEKGSYTHVLEKASNRRKPPQNPSEETESSNAETTESTNAETESNNE